MPSFFGTSGPDTLIGSASNDFMSGAGGDDYIDGQEGADEMWGGDGNDTFVVDNVGDQVIEFDVPGWDQLQTSLAFYMLPANVEELVYIGGGNFHGIGNSLTNHLYGGAGNDILSGGAGADHMVGKAGNDTYYVENAGDTISELANQGFDRVYVSLASYTLPAHVETLLYNGPLSQGFTGTGNGLVNLIEGGNGNDILDGKGGADTIIGYGGDDEYIVDDQWDDLVEKENGGTDRVHSFAAIFWLPQHIENLTFVGSNLTSFTGTGNNLANIIIGRGGNDVLDGKGGADTLIGKAGNDLYHVDHAGDQVVEAANEGIDTVRTSLQIYTLPANVENLAYWGPANLQFIGAGNSLANHLSGLNGDDHLDGKGGADTMVGGWGNDIYIVDHAGDVVVEHWAEGIDSVTVYLAGYTLGPHLEKLHAGLQATDFVGNGNSLDNEIRGYDGNDVLDGMGGADILAGQKGNDIYYVDHVGDTVSEKAGEGSDQVRTTLSSYTLPAHVENLLSIGAFSAPFHGIGNALANTIQGSGGDDTLNGMGGADLMIGGPGNDVYHVDDVGDFAQEAVGEGSDTVVTTLSAYVLGSHLEKLIYFGDSNAAFTGIGNGLDNHLEGWNGNDTLDGAGGADIMVGLGGNDVYFVDHVFDQVIEEGNGGIDEVRTALGSRADFSQMYTLPGHVENLTGTSGGAQGVYGNALNNHIRMGAGGDLIVLHDGGADKVESGGGNDFIYYGATFTNADSNDGGAGSDTVGLLGTYTLVFDADDLVSIEKLALYGSGNPAAPNHYTVATIDANVAAGQQLTVIAMSLSAIETFTFNGQAETDGSFSILGGKGSDTISAGAGNDLIWGNLGADTLKGGGGNDSFEYYSVAESTPQARDTILDLSPGDRINLWTIDADGNAGNGNSAFAWIGSAAFSQVAGQLRAAQTQNGWLVEGDINGDGVADLAILVQTANGHILTAADFIL
jgi:Ca2+-binding RTX toxin-like protein